MRGGAQAHLMRCSNENYYVVKFQNNPQHRRVLVNEMLGTRLASRLGLPTAPVSVVEVPEELIRLTAELCFETPRAQIPARRGCSLPRAIRKTRGEWRCTISCRTKNSARWTTCTISRGCWCSTSGPATPTAGRRCFLKRRGALPPFRRGCLETEQPARERRAAGRPRGISHGDDRPGILLQRRGMEFSGCAAARFVRAQPRV
jgi:hypothetical protein